MKLTHYQNQANVVDTGLLRQDAIDYSVLISILHSPCSDVFTDHESVILCYSLAPSPVWVWAKDLNNDEAVRAVADCLRTYFPVSQGHTYNVSYPLLERLREVDPYFRSLEVKLGLLSYRLDNLNPIHYPCGGHFAPARQEDLEPLIPIWHAMNLEMENHDFSESYCREQIGNHLTKGTLFTWRDEADQIVALTAKWADGGYCKLSAVYTLPRHRRKGYAINLVHKVTQSVLDEGLIPILYTDAGYIASNDCYKKIGYRQVGSLCTIG